MIAAPEPERLRPMFVGRGRMTLPTRQTLAAIRRALPATLVVVACSFDRDPAVRNPRVVVISLQGASAQRARAMLDRLPTIARLAETGTGLAATIPVDAPSTATARATFETGATATVHGIVASSFHVRGDSIGRGRSGFNTSYVSETVYDAVARQGRSVATIGIANRPGLDLTSRIAAVTAGRAIVPARLATLTRDRASDTTRIVSAGDTADLIVRLEGGLVTVRVALRAAPYRVTPLPPGEWVPVWLTDTSPRTGTWLKVLSVTPDSTRARVYLGAAVMTDAAPATLATELESASGPAPANPDYGNHATGVIDDDTWRDQVLREARYLTAAAERVQRSLQPNLVIVALNLLDAHEQQFLRTHPRHPVFRSASERDQARWRSHIEGAYVLADSLVGRLAANATGAPEVVDVPFLPGEHAFDPALPETHGVFVAAGAGVERAAITRVEASDVAVTAAAALGMAPPRGATGRSKIRVGPGEARRW